MNLDKKTSFAIGRRKQAIAQVQLEVGVGNFCINGRSADDYFQYNQNFLKQTMLKIRLMCLHYLNYISHSHLL